MRCAIVVPVHGKAALTRQCVDALLREERRTEAGVVVVDDGSPDWTPELLASYGERIRIVRHDVAQGFAAACNAGARAADGELVCFLNNDVVPGAGWLDALVDDLDEHPEAAIAGSKLLYPDGTVQHAGVVICLDRIPRHVYRGFPSDHPAVMAPRELQVVTGACLLIRRTVFDAAGGFDTSYVNGYEDVDLCLRVRAAGHAVRFCPESVLVHLESVSRGSRFDVANQELYDERWRPHVVPDELDVYRDDGLLCWSYGEHYPLRLEIAPELASVQGAGADERYERLLLRRAEQVWSTLRDNVALTVEANERGGGHRPAVPASDRVQRRHAAAEPTPVSGGTIHTLGAGGRLVSVCLPVKDGGARLVRLLDALLAQDADCRLELVAIDSGSSDGSVEALVARGSRVVAIPPQDFNHGGTRNALARLADGDPLVYLSQRAEPAHDTWLRALVDALDADDTLAAACSRVLPPPGFSILAERDAVRDPSSSPVPDVRALGPGEAGRLAPHELRLRVNFHTVSAAIRRAALDRVPFREVEAIGEDVLWALEVMEAGWRIRHEPASAVWHGDDLPLQEILGRNVDDGTANAGIVGRRLPRGDVLPQIEGSVRDDWAFLAGLGLDPERLQREQIASVLRRAAQTVGQYVGCNPDEVPPGLTAALSQVERRVTAREPSAR